MAGIFPSPAVKVIREAAEQIKSASQSPVEDEGGGVCGGADLNALVRSRHH